MEGALGVVLGLVGGVWAWCEGCFVGSDRLDCVFCVFCSMLLLALIRLHALCFEDN